MTTASLPQSPAVPAWLQRLVARYGREPICAVGVVLLVCILTYGIFVTRLGIYYDDLVWVYMLQRLSLSQFIDIQWGNARPLFAVVTWLQGNNALLAHGLMFVMHIAICLLLLRLLRFALPGMRLLALAAVVLYAVYPVYWLRPVNVAMGLESGILFMLLSLTAGLAALTARGLRRAGLAALSLGLVTLSFFTYESALVLELARPVLIALVCFRQPGSLRGRALRTVAWSALWVGYVAMLVGYRLFLFESTGFYASIGYNPVVLPTDVETFSAYTSELSRSVSGVFTAWGDQLARLNAEPNIVFSLGGGLAALAFALYGLAFARNERPGLLRLAGAFVIGAALLAAGLVPVLLTGNGRNISTEGLWSRAYITSVIGAGLMLAALVLYIIIPTLRRAGVYAGLLVLAALIGVGTAAHMRNAATYAAIWERQREFWWQLGWRVPDVLDGTLIIMDYQIGREQYSYETFALGDLFYRNPSVVGLEAQSVLPEGGGFIFDNGNWSFGWRYTLERAILAWQRPGQCLRIIDPAQPLPEGVDLSEPARNLLPLLPDPDTIIRRTPQREFTDRGLFLPEPARGACYDFQREALAASDAQ